MQPVPLLLPLPVAPLHGSLATDLVRYVQDVPDDDLLDGDFTPAVDLGLTASVSDPIAFQASVSTRKPVAGTLGDLAVYRRHDCDLLVVPVTSSALDALATHLRSQGARPAIPRLKTPVVVLARLAPGAGKGYHGDPIFAGITATFDTVVAGGVSVKLNGRQLVDLGANPIPTVTPRKAPAEPATPTPAQKAAQTLTEALERLGSEASGLLGRLVGRGDGRAFRKAVRLVENAKGATDGDKVRLLSWLAKAWKRGDSVGTLASGKPVYRWTNEDGQSRDQHSEPGTGRKPAAAKGEGASKPAKAPAKKPAPKKAPKADPEAVKQQVLDYKAQPMDAADLPARLEATKAALLGLTVDQIKALDLGAVGKKKEDLVNSVLGLAGGKGAEAKPKAAAKKPAAKKPAKPTPEQIHEEIKQELANPTADTPGRVKALLMGLTQTQIKEFAMAREASASGKKEAMAEMVAKQVALKARQQKLREEANRPVEPKEWGPRKEDEPGQAQEEAQAGEPEQPTDANADLREVPGKSGIFEDAMGRRYKLVDGKRVAIGDEEGGESADAKTEEEKPAEAIADEKTAEPHPEHHEAIKDEVRATLKDFGVNVEGLRERAESYGQTAGEMVRGFLPSDLQEDKGLTNEHVERAIREVEAEGDQAPEKPKEPEQTKDEPAAPTGQLPPAPSENSLPDRLKDVPASQLVDALAKDDKLLATFPGIRAGLRGAGDSSKDKLYALSNADTDILDSIFSNPTATKVSGLVSNEYLRQIQKAHAHYEEAAAAGMGSAGEDFEREVANIRNGMVEKLIPALRHLADSGVVVKGIDGTPLDIHAAADLYQSYGLGVIDALVKEVQAGGEKPASEPQQQPQQEEKPAPQEPAPKAPAEPKPGTFRFAPDLHPEARKALTPMLNTLKKSAHLTTEQRVEYANTAQEVLGRMNPKALARFQAHATGEPVFAADLAGVRQAIRDLSSPRDQAKLDAIKGEIGGCYHRSKGKGRLVLDGGHDLSGRKDVHSRQTKTAKDIYAHEFSHAIDGPKHELSGSSEWQQAWKEELAGGRLNPYSATKASEGFAEFGRFLHAGEVTLEQIKKALPKCYAYWESQGLLPEEKS